MQIYLLATSIGISLVAGFIIGIVTSGFFKEQVELGTILAILGGVASGTSVFQVIWQVFTKPRFKINPEVKQVTDSGTHYGYLDLIITNNGNQTAKDCELTLTVVGAGSRFENVPLKWGNPRQAHTLFSDKIDVKGGDDFKTVIFELMSDRESAFVQNRAGRRIEVTKGCKYTFIFSVNSDPPAKKSVKYEVDVKDWNDIKMQHKWR